MRLRVLALLLTFVAAGVAQELTTRRPEIKKAPGNIPNSNATYQQLKALSLMGDSVDVTNLVLKRDVATFTFESGTFQFTPAVNGMITGAAFVGRGKVVIEPAMVSERFMLKKLTKGVPYEETFSSVVFRFTDGTDKEIKSSKTAAGSSAPKGSGQFDEVKRALRDDLHYNLTGRILNDVLTGSGGMFWAFINGEKYSKKQVFEVDPFGAVEFKQYGAYYDMAGSDFVPQRIGPEEVALVTYDNDNEATYVAEHTSAEIQAGAAASGSLHGLFDIDHQVLDTQIEKNGQMAGDATTTITAHFPARVVPLQLFYKFKVASVTGEDGQPLDFIQEDRKADWGFYVILSMNRKKDDKATFRITYAGKDAISNEGGGNYYVVGDARDSWYPSIGFGHYSTFDVTFRIPKKHTMAATGKLVQQADEGEYNVSTWKAEVPQQVAGFNFGRFKTQQVKLDKEQYVITGFVNEEQPDIVKAISRFGTMGTMSTTPMLNRNVSEAQLAMQLYTALFGPSPYKDLAVTQQTACEYGQAWPGLVYLPICAFFDSTVRHQLGYDFDRGYWQVVGPHEVAHQWWGHLVGFDGGRDQWMSEGFSEFAASMFLQNVYTKEPKRYFQFWKDELDLLTEKNVVGRRPIDAGPLVAGYRLNTKKDGWDIAGLLIYPKGGYVLHMIRMMMMSNQTGDQAFIAMMKDFGQTYAHRAATTEDFKAMVEKHITPVMNMQRNGKMDWFFDHYVYGTTLPTYKFEHSFGNASAGKVRMHMKITQSGVPDDFIMPVPVYLELPNGGIARLGSIPMRGNTTFEQDVELPLPQKPKRAMINYYYDVLSLTN